MLKTAAGEAIPKFDVSPRVGIAYAEKKTEKGYGGIR